MPTEGIIGQEIDKAKQSGQSSNVINLSGMRDEFLGSRDAKKTIDPSQLTDFEVAIIIKALRSNDKFKDQVSGVTDEALKTQLRTKEGWSKWMESNPQGKDFQGKVDWRDLISLDASSTNNTQNTRVVNPAVRQGIEQRVNIIAEMLKKNGATITDAQKQATVDELAKTPTLAALILNQALSGGGTGSGNYNGAGITDWIRNVNNFDSNQTSSTQNRNQDANPQSTDPSWAARYNIGSSRLREMKIDEGRIDLYSNFLNDLNLAVTTKVDPNNPNSPTVLSQGDFLKIVGYIQARMDYLKTVSEKDEFANSQGNRKRNLVRTIYILNGVKDQFKRRGLSDKDFEEFVDGIAGPRTATSNSLPDEVSKWFTGQGANGKGNGVGLLDIQAALQSKDPTKVANVVASLEKDSTTIRENIRQTEENLRRAREASVVANSRVGISTAEKTTTGEWIFRQKDQIEFKLNKGRGGIYDQMSLGQVVVDQRIGEWIRNNQLVEWDKTTAPGEIETFDAKGKKHKQKAYLMDYVYNGEYKQYVITESQWKELNKLAETAENRTNGANTNRRGSTLAQVIRGGTQIFGAIMRPFNPRLASQVRNLGSQLYNPITTLDTMGILPSPFDR